MASTHQKPVTDVGALWSRTATAAPECAALNGSIEADFVIVGGGLTGTRTALGLAEHGAKVVLLEARTIGWGASGRSGGQCNPIWRKTPDMLAQLLGDSQATRLIETTLKSADALFGDIEKYGISCDGEQTGWVQAAHHRPAQTDLEHLAQAWNAAGANIDILDAAQTRTATGSELYDFALFHPRGGHVQPLSLTRGFARTAVKFGATLFENSPVQAVTRTGDKWTVTTPNGAVRTGQVILTTNAYSDNLWPKLRQTFLPMVSISLATAPLSDNLQKTVLPNAVTISDTRRAIYYARYDRDRRLVFGCVGSTEDAAVLGGIKRLKGGLNKVFPQLNDIEIETTWGGSIAVTPEMMPHLHEPEPGILAALGFSGRGIAMTSVMARTLVRKALGASNDSLPFPVTDIKPIPFHGIAKAVLPLAAPAMTLRDRLDSVFTRS
jgi:glycine/D-amino acid oxidase-like deaminating enzyme